MSRVIEESLRAPEMTNSTPANQNGRGNDENGDAADLLVQENELPGKDSIERLQESVQDAWNRNPGDPNEHKGKRPPHCDVDNVLPQFFQK